MQASNFTYRPVRRGVAAVRHYHLLIGITACVVSIAGIIGAGDLVPFPICSILASWASFEAARHNRRVCDRCFRRLLHADDADFDRWTRSMQIYHKIFDHGFVFIGGSIGLSLVCLLMPDPLPRLGAIIPWLAVATLITNGSNHTRFRHWCKRCNDGGKNRPQKATPGPNGQARPR